MRKLLLNFMVVTSIPLTYSQVGIGTTTPQEQLYITGNTSTIRIGGIIKVDRKVLNEKRCER